MHKEDEQKGKKDAIWQQFPKHTNTYVRTYIHAEVYGHECVYDAGKVLYNDADTHPTTTGWKQQWD